MASLLGLPPIPPILKPLTSFLQRAEELKTKDPLMAYWCTYYAAQLGITSNSKDPTANKFLLSLLGKLETMKQEIGPNDAIDMEAASAAYVENFGIRVFVGADNEDRRGTATRATAKKFIAAANFLEVLQTFPDTEAPEKHGDKIKYAKWKAADIAKAFREGRKPVAGPAGGEPEPEQGSLPEGTGPIEAVESSSNRFTDPTSLDPEQTPVLPSADELPPPKTPDTWSTVATPGESTLNASNVFGSTPTPPTHGHGHGLVPPPFPRAFTGASTESIYEGDLNNVHNVDPEEPYNAPRAPPAAGIIGDPSATPAAIPSAPPMDEDDPQGMDPIVVSRAQKHCKYAISALDYEDKKTAEKELRAALALIQSL